MFGQRRRVWLMLVFSLALILNGCGPSPTPTAPPVAVGTPEAPTPTPVPPRPTSAPPTLEPVTSRFRREGDENPARLKCLYCERVSTVDDVKVRLHA